MKRILLDENIPLKLVHSAPSDCEVRHVLAMGWAQMSDGELLANAEADGFDVFLTADRGIAYQQDLRAKRIALLVLTTNNWPVVRAHATSIFVRALSIDDAAVETIALPRSAHQRNRE